MELRSRFKLSLIFMLAAAPTAVALAQPVDCPICHFNGFTVGLGLGATTFMTNTKSNATVISDHTLAITALVPAPTPGNQVINNVSSNTYHYGGMGAIYVGYGWVSGNHLYLGSELGLNWLGATHTNLKSTATNNVDVTYTDNQAGLFSEALVYNSLETKTKVTRNSVEPFLDFKFGWLMTPTALAYVKGGFNYNTIKVKTDSTYQASGSATGSVVSQLPLKASIASAFTNRLSRSSIGYRAGVGTDVFITPEFSVGVEYVYSLYRKINASHSGTIRDVGCDALQGCQVVPANIANASKAPAYDQQVMAQLIYHLG